MKKLLLLLLAAVTFSFIGCSKDDEIDTSKIIGVWYETYYWDTGTFSGNPNTWHTWGFISGYVHEFLPDKTYKCYSSLSDYKKGEVYSEGTYSFDGNSLSINGGFKRKITFTESGDGFEWEQNAICVRYTGE